MIKNFFKQKSPEKNAQSPNVKGLLEQQYNDQVRQNHIQSDNTQLKVLHHLQTLMETMLLHIDYEQQSTLHKLISDPPDQGRSLYIYGGVGSGKSMLMDMFYLACPIMHKRRVHFHAFMLEVHDFMHQWRQQQNGDAISALANNIRDSAQLLCFDEFHVTDIADAMILGRLFGQLFKLGIVVVITSNRHPEDLYQGGLQRELFLPFIKLLQETAEVLELNTTEDYRLIHLHALETTYYCPLDDHAAEFIQHTYDELTNFATVEPGSIRVYGRDIDFSSVHGDIVLTSFDELCTRALGSADYLEIACEFNTMIMSGIPELTPEKRNEAKRFVTLIDALYEHKVKMICSAAVPAQELYIQGDGAFEFQRTVSRLTEMQSDKYLHSEHLSD